MAVYIAVVGAFVPLTPITAPGSACSAARFTAYGFKMSTGWNDGFTPATSATSERASFSFGSDSQINLEYQVKGTRSAVKRDTSSKLAERTPPVSERETTAAATAPTTRAPSASVTGWNDGYAPATSATSVRAGFMYGSESQINLEYKIKEAMEPASQLKPASSSQLKPSAAARKRVSLDVGGRPAPFVFASESQVNLERTAPQGRSAASKAPSQGSGAAAEARRRAREYDGNGLNAPFIFGSDSQVNLQYQMQEAEERDSVMAARNQAQAAAASSAQTQVTPPKVSKREPATPSKVTDWSALRDQAQDLLAADGASNAALEGVLGEARRAMHMLAAEVAKSA